MINAAKINSVTILVSSILSPVYPNRYRCSGSWKGPDSLELRIHPPPAETYQLDEDFHGGGAKKMKRRK